VLDTSDEIVVVQIFEGTGGLSKDSAVKFTGDVIKMPLSPAIIGRVLSGSAGQEMAALRSSLKF